MCKNHHNGRKRKAHTPRAKFYRNLKSFLIFNLVFAVLSIMGGGFPFLKISAIWGIFLAIGYVKAFGLPGTNGWFSDDWEDWMTERELRYSPEEDYDRPEWREKDLV